MQHLYLPYLLYFCTWTLQSNAEQCLRKNVSNGVRCIAEDGISDVSASECFAKDHCCLSKNVCYAKRLQSAAIVEEIDEEDMKMEMQFILREFETVSMRALILGPPVQLPYGGEAPYPGFSELPAFVCQKRPSFMDICRDVNVETARFSRLPPLNIPYCVRIPCDSKRPELDKRPGLCRSVPGCYFDRRLSDHRGYYGHSFMPGVPVCHLAIRNAVFQEEAKKIVNEAGAWSSYLTECLLNTFDDVIRAQKDGCRHIPMLRYFNHKPKLAGWKSIKEYECVLLDGCWSNGECLYPVDMRSLTVRSAAPEPEMVPSALYYGRPKCQVFDDKTPSAAIKSYHNCLISGCKVDMQARMTYYNYLYEFGKTMKVSDHWVFWRNVESGKYGAHNFDEYDPLPKQDVTVTPFSLAIPYPVEGTEADLLSEVLKPGSASILDMLKSPENVKLPPSHIKPAETFFQQLQGLTSACSSTFTSFGSRPCGPPKYKPPGNPEDCPFKPITVKGLKPLMGSLEGCCDINLCYIPKEEILTARSGAAVYLSEWSYWTECTTTCGKGTKKRWRKCIGIDRSKCREKLAEKMTCEIQECSSWGAWDGWTPCPVSCGGGVRSRMRGCIPKGGNCPGQREEVKSCAATLCGVPVAMSEPYGTWLQWTGSCNPCGKTRYRQRDCLVTNCDIEKLSQTRQCAVQCGTWTTWSNFGSCDYDFHSNTCHRSRTRQCLDSRDNPAHCEGFKSQFEDCDCPWQR